MQAVINVDGIKPGDYIHFKNRTDHQGMRLVECSDFTSVLVEKIVFRSGRMDITGLTTIGRITYRDLPFTQLDIYRSELDEESAILTAVADKLVDTESEQRRAFVISGTTTTHYARL